MCQETCENRDDEQVSQDRVWYFLLVCGAVAGRVVVTRKSARAQLRRPSRKGKWIMQEMAAWPANNAQKADNAVQWQVGIISMSSRCLYYCARHRATRPEHVFIPWHMSCTAWRYERSETARGWIQWGRYYRKSGKPPVKKVRFIMRVNLKYFSQQTDHGCQNNIYFEKLLYTFKSWGSNWWKDCVVTSSEM